MTKPVKTDEVAVGFSGEDKATAERIVKILALALYNRTITNVSYREKVGFIKYFTHESPFDRVYEVRDNDLIELEAILEEARSSALSESTLDSYEMQFSKIYDKLDFACTSFRALRMLFDPKTVWSPTGEVNVHDVVEEVVKSLRFVLKNVPTEIDVDARLTFPLDRSLFATMLRNLITNATRSIEKGGFTEKKVRVASRVESGLLIVDVEDSGIGVTDEVIDLIKRGVHFSRFGGGSGIGLQIVHKVVSLASGELVPMARPYREGAIFQVRIPSVSVKELA